MFYHTTGNFQTRGHGPANKRAKKELVSKGRAHGVIVYRDGKPVGWCQYGVKKNCPELIPAASIPNQFRERKTSYGG